VRAPDPRNQLLESIRAGTNLKKAADRESVQEDADISGQGDIAAALRNALNNRQKHLGAESDDDSAATDDDW
jgi:hypothetical protein